MAAPPALAPAQHQHPNNPHHLNPAQEPINDQSLREHHVPSSYPPPPPTEYERAAIQPSTPPSTHDYQSTTKNLDPAIGGSSSAMSAGGDSGGEDSPGDGRKGYGKRELSTSKRAAQNRAAQRAFRQRKEGYIKKLEEQVREFAGMSESYKVLQAENYQLRDYIISLQSRLLESQGDYPQPPPNVNLAHPSEPRQQHLDRHEPPQAGARSTQMEYDALNQLRAAARQDFAASNKHLHEAAYGSEARLAKRIKADGEPAEQTAAAQEALQGGSIAIEPRITTSPQSRDLSVGSVLNQNTRDRNNSRPLLSA